ncbi:hypothetical protein DFH09DRAFT_1409379 [Mycena vulgaris]|nr:hypothetical protein DFH09DRAFT_1409379 [Mycena vulgaris]
MALESRIANVVHQGKTAAELLRTVSEVTNTPYLRPIAGACVLLMDTVITVRKSKEECLRMAEKVGTIIMILVNICYNTDAELPSSILSHIATFSETLQKVLVFVRRQVRTSLIKRVVRHLEDSALISECHLALADAIEVFKLQCGVTTITSLAQFQADASRHDSELWKLLIARDSSSTLSTLHSRSSSISLLPGSPQIFHGRDAELKSIVSNLLQEAPSRIAILGTGGVGKSSLSLAALCNPDIATKFGSGRHFISCESSQSAEDIAAVLSSHFALEGNANPTKAVLEHLSSQDTPCIVVLDNLETPWEFPGGCSAVEDFLSHLSAIDTVHLIITMRGEERPGKVRWSRPFLRPLAPLSDLAARQVFRDITDAADSDIQVDELLQFTDNLPLAVTLMANLVAFEGAAPVLDRWQSERICMLSEGSDKRSNLSTSIMMSLSSPRLTAIPDALTLLGLLSVLPDGVTDSTLMEMDLPLTDIALCRVTLCRTSLAYVDHDRRLKALVPIREHMRAFHPSSPLLISRLQDFFYNLVSLFCKKWARAVGTGLVQRLSSDLGNIHSLIHTGLQANNPPSTETISCILDLARFTRATYIGSWDLLHSISEIVHDLADPDLQGRYFVALSRIDAPDTPVESYLTKAIHYFQMTENVSAQAMAYRDLSLYHIKQGDINKALQMSECALPLAMVSHDHNVLAQVLRGMSGVLHNFGNLRRAWALTLEAQAHAQAGGDLDTEFLCILNRVSHFITAGNYARAADLCSDLMSLAQGLGVENGDRGLDALFMQGEIHLRKTEYDQARSIYMVIAEMTAHDGKQQHDHGLALANLFLVDLATGGNVDHGSVQVYRTLDAGARWRVLCDINTADIFHGLGELTQADKLYNQCLDLVGSNAEKMNECFQKLGDNAYSGSQIDVAFQYYVLHLALSRRMDDYDNTHQALRRIGDIFCHRGDDKTARSLFMLSLDGFTLMDVHKGRADCLIRLGDLMKGEGNMLKAARYWEQALSLYERSSQTEAVGKCNLRLGH